MLRVLNIHPRRNAEMHPPPRTWSPLSPIRDPRSGGLDLAILELGQQSDGLGTRR